MWQLGRWRPLQDWGYICVCWLTHVRRPLPVDFSALSCCAHWFCSCMNVPYANYQNSFLCCRIKFYAWHSSSDYMYCALCRTREHLSSLDRTRCFKVHSYPNHQSTVSFKQAGLFPRWDTTVQETSQMLAPRGWYMQARHHCFPHWSCDGHCSHAR